MSVVGTGTSQGGQLMTCENHDWRYVNTVGDTVHYECTKCGQMMSETQGSDYNPPVSAGDY